jgi:hypothetical protein
LERKQIFENLIYLSPELIEIMLNLPTRQNLYAGVIPEDVLEVIIVDSELLSAFSSKQTPLPMMNLHVLSIGA